ncbi:hypothetical protein BDZ94DRAFT_1241507 [Collybia nuda]|uniref:Deoxyribonuclease NucA/NucB domain-containing protein n=1 Tax=Collybia nuda TaxID=64659 RepID=A0A9P5XT10_9AGAR|nr:hypothetical protein BDZ94DRAFT_1241507 [Collybia nuda]
MVSRALSYLVVSALLYTQAVAVVFTFDCKKAPGVCDTHCFARSCAGIDWAHKGFHRDALASSRQPKPNSKTTSNDLRRQAIGCVNSNPCSGGSTCDELPYASTYDGGLGCVPQGFGGNSKDLYQQGVVHCVAGTENQVHGALLNTFYNKEKIADGALFTVGLLNEASAPLCQALQKNKNSCPKQGDKGPPSTKFYLARSAPDGTYCPGRARASLNGPRSEDVDRREVVSKPARYAITDNGMRIREAVGEFSMGERVWSMSDDGIEITSTIVAFE